MPLKNGVRHVLQRYMFRHIPVTAEYGMILLRLLSGAKVGSANLTLGAHLGTYTSPCNSRIDVS